MSWAPSRMLSTTCGAVLRLAARMRRRAVELLEDRRLLHDDRAGRVPCGAVHVRDDPGAAGFVRQQRLRRRVDRRQGAGDAVLEQRRRQRDRLERRRQLGDDAVGREGGRGACLFVHLLVGAPRRLVADRTLGERLEQPGEVRERLLRLSRHQRRVGGDAADEAEPGRRGRVVEGRRIEQDRHGLTPAVGSHRPGRRAARGNPRIIAPPLQATGAAGTSISDKVEGDTCA